MASRKDLALIKAARNGDPNAQVELGKRYIFGGDGLSKSETAAYHWLSKAAIQGQKEACVLIAEHVSFSTITAIRDRQTAHWFKSAFEQGVRSAGIIFGRLILEELADATEDGAVAYSYTQVEEALRVLEELAKEGDAEAKWLFSKHHIAKRQLTMLDGVDISEQSDMSPSAQLVQEWLGQAADAGVQEAEFVLLDRLWVENDLVEFHRRAESFITGLVRKFSGSGLQYFEKSLPKLQIPEKVSTLLMRSALVQQQLPHIDLNRLRSVLELVAMAGKPEAFLQLGLLHARMDANGNRLMVEEAEVEYEKAAFCLSQDMLIAHPDACYALYLIHLDSDFCQQDAEIGMRYLAKAAELGHAQAQFEFGQIAWLNKQDGRDNDISAFYWWQKAKDHGHKGAQEYLYRYGSHAVPAEWAVTARAKLLNKYAQTHPFLLARIELAAMFGLSRSEALSIDVRSADRGHCLLVDLKGVYLRAKRRLIPIETREQRILLDKMGRLFGNVDCGPTGPEGSYRARQERLMRLLREN
ncbi:TPR repeat protein [Herbaspirillum sp. 1173]|uniref:tetratricopeptide repeat protein n=1 Tax=Herbaspirillum sp. 1173 TaxID=2817734 RepID=UPI00285A5E5D|nr:hypothetical protein [Herbaspirillum sp. 1173]MDR6743071.1 TPR repeat protein [Herbaspirillum sp. 1173]